MAESREREDEYEDEELDEALEEEVEELDDVSVSGDAEGLTISERRARRKARRKQKDTVEASDDSPAPTSTAKEIRTRSQKEAIRDRERQGHARGENVPVVGSLLSYFRGVVAEMQKVTWPTQEEARRLTYIVIIVTLIFSVFLGAIDIFSGWWFEQGITDTGLFLLVGVPVVFIGGGLSWFYILREQD
jgi:preprotein translocase subunit SecE